MNKKILIIGANGFLGNALYHFLKKKLPKTAVCAMSRRKRGDIKGVYVCNLRHTSKLKKLLKEMRPDIIFNLAGGRLEDEKKLFENNYTATFSLFKAVAEIDNYEPRIIIAGTAAEYGPPPRGVKLIRETTETNPISWYGFVKDLQTKLSVEMATKNMDVVVVRMFNILGKGVGDNLAIGKFSKDIIRIERKKRSPVIKTRNLDGKRDFLDIKDVVSALYQIALKGKTGEIYNICSGHSYTIRDLLHKLTKLSKRKDLIVSEEVNESSESCDIIGSNAKLKRATSWKQEISIDQSLKETLEYYRRKIG